MHPIERLRYVARAGAVDQGELVREAAAGWNDGIVARWSALHARNLRTRQRVCRGLSRAMRRPRLLGAALPVMNALPAAVAPISAWLNRDFRLPTVVRM